MSKNRQNFPQLPRISFCAYNVLLYHLQPGPIGGHVGQHPPEALNKKALEIIQRVRDKLTGRDFDPKELLGVAQQVDNLIIQVLLNMAAM